MGQWWFSGERSQACPQVAGLSAGSRALPFSDTGKTGGLSLGVRIGTWEHEMPTNQPR